MPKSKASKVDPSKPKAVKPPGDPARSRRVRHVLLHLLGVVALVGGLGFLVDVTRQYIEREVPSPAGPLRVALVNKPLWMSDYLAEQIATTVPKNSSSAFDQNLLVETAGKLAKNPWVAKVNQVRRVYGEQPGDTLEVDCEFRAPIALVKWGEYYWMIDNEGTVLPEQFTHDQLDKIAIGRDGRTSMRVIQGVHQAPPGSGNKWPGADLSAGLELVKLFYGKLYLDEVVAVDVTNYAGRVKRADPQLVLETRYGSQIWWGRPLNTKDFFVEVPAARKLEILKAVVQQHGRIDANQAYVDVRYDDFLVPSSQPASQARTVDDPNK
jgi:cell division septal protein FtsQ